MPSLIRRSALRHVLLATFALPLPLHAQGGLSTEQVMQLQTVTTADLSPDVRQVAYTVTRMRRGDEAPGGAYRTVCTADACSATSPASPPAPSRPPSAR